MQAKQLCILQYDCSLLLGVWAQLPTLQRAVQYPFSVVLKNADHANNADTANYVAQTANVDTGN